jgi:serine/threonine protein kinase
MKPDQLQCWNCAKSVDEDRSFCDCLRDGYPTPLRFDKYRVEKSLGRGAFGSVYKCADPDVDRFVAVKKLFPNARSISGELARIRSSGALVHDNIVRILDVTPGDGVIVMEYLAGGTLADKLASDGRWVIANFSRLMLEVCDAIRAAHSESIIHRDIKPENILLDADGKAKVADFGVCAILSTLDHTNGIAGSPPYMAPEVLEGIDYSFEADVHSLGCVMYEIWSGRLPWFASGGIASYLAVKSRSQPPELREVSDLEVNELLNDLVSRTLTNGPRRIKTIDLVAQQLLLLDPKPTHKVSTLDDLYGMLLVLYGYANTNKTPNELLEQYNIALRAVTSPLVERRERSDATARLFVKAFAWMCAFFASINLRPSQLIWLKYDGSCPYCCQAVCACADLEPMDEDKRNELLLARMGGRWAEAAPGPRTFQEYQAIFRRMYGARNEKDGINIAVIHAYSEVAEASDALLHLSTESPDKLLVLHLEASDLIAWFYGLLNMYDPDIDFIGVFEDTFRDGCYACTANPCRCPEPLGVSEWRRALRMVPDYEQ